MGSIGTTTVMLAVCKGLRMEDRECRQFNVHDRKSLRFALAFTVCHEAVNIPA